MSTFDAFLSLAWTEHAEAPNSVAARLPDALSLVQSDDHVSRLAHLAHHVLGEHLHQWNDGIAFLSSLAASGYQGEVGSAALARYRASLRLCGDGVSEFQNFTGSDQCRISVMAASNLATDDSTRSSALLEDAVARALCLPNADPGVRAVAAFSNSIAANLQELVARSLEQRELMIRAAQIARSQWERAGTWLETERAEYRLAVCWAAAGDSRKALHHAMACESIVQVNQSLPLELFFAAEALAIASLGVGDQARHNAAVNTAITAFAELPQEDQDWCRPTLARLTQA